MEADAKRGTNSKPAASQGIHDGPRQPTAPILPRRRSPRQEHSCHLAAADLRPMVNAAGKQTTGRSRNPARQSVKRRDKQAKMI